MPALSRYDGTTEGSNSPGHPDQHIDALGSNPEEDEGPQNAPVTLEDTTTETTEPEYTTIIVLLEGRGLEIVQEISNSGCNDEEQLFQLETARQDPTLTTNDRHLIIAARLQILYRRRAVQGPTNGQLTSSRASQENVNSSIASPAVVAPMTTNPPHNVQQDHQTPTPTPVPAVPIPTATNPLIDSTIGAFLARHISTLFPNHRAYLAALIVASRNTALPLADRHAITQQINNIFSADLSDISADLPYVSAEIDAQLRRSDPTYDDDMSSVRNENGQLELSLAEYGDLMRVASPSHGFDTLTGSVPRVDPPRAQSEPPQSGHFYRHVVPGMAYGEDTGMRAPGPFNTTTPPDYPNLWTPVDPESRIRQQALRATRTEFAAIANEALVELRSARSLAGLDTLGMDEEIACRVMLDVHHWGDLGKLMVRSRWWQPAPIDPRDWDDEREEERVVWSTYRPRSSRAMIID